MKPPFVRVAAGEARSRHEMRVVELAARQHACVTTAQLKLAGMSREAIAYRVQTGWMTRLHRAVYRVGPLSDPLTSQMAALLACGAESALCDRTALAMWELLLPMPAIVDVAVRGNRRSREGIRVHRDHLLDKVTIHLGCRITTPAATIADTAPQLSTKELARVIDQAQILRLAGQDELRAALPSRRSRALGAALEQPRLTRSEAERRLLELIDRAGLGRPHANVRVYGSEVDLLWTRQRLIVEVDGFAFHSTREAFERDRARDAGLTARGYRVIRLTWRQIVREPEATVARLAAALARF